MSQSLSLCGLLCLLLGGCSETVSSSDGFVGGGREPGEKCVNGIDKWVDIETAAPLKPGEQIQDTICPVGDIDYFRVSVKPSHELLRVELKRATTISDVKLTYLILDQRGKTVGSSPPREDGSYNALHCLAAGDYTLLVQDEGNDAQDGTNPYIISFDSEDDPDKAEANDDFDSARELSGDVSGYIACATDADFYTISVEADQLLEVKLTTAGATPVDVKYTIYDAERQWVADELDPDGFRGAAELTTLHALPKAGQYFIKVEDNNNDEADPKVAYTLSASTKNEEDPNDRGLRNDTPATATPIGSGPEFDETIRGQIASKADVDYYRISGLSNVDADNPAVIELSVSYDGSTAIEPAIALIYGDPNSPCTKDACCRVLAPDGPGCTNDEFDCAGSSFSCIAKGDTFCSDEACSPGASTNCPMARRCAGAAVCLPAGHCGAAQVVRFDSDGGDGASIGTAQPLVHSGPWYIRVTDHQNNDYQHGKDYTLRVRLRMDPDGDKELNSYYNPNTLSTSLKSAARAQNVKIAEKKNIVLTVPFTVRGTISYEGDKDWYLMKNPCPGDACTLTATYKAIGSGCASGPAFVYSLLYADGRDKDNWPKSPAAAKSGTFGASNNCWLSRNSDDYILTINDHGFDDWSWSCGYEVSVSVHENSCSAPCQVYNNTCYVPTP